MSSRPPLRSTLRVAIKALLLVLALIALLTVVITIAVSTETGRKYTCTQIETLINDAIPGKVHLGRCVSLWPTRLRIERGSVSDPSGRTVLDVSAIEAEPDLLALLGGKVRTRRAEIEEPRLRLVDHDGNLAIAAAFTSEDDESSETSDLEFEFQDTRVFDGTVEDLPQGLSVTEINTEGDVIIHEHGVVVHVRALEADVMKLSQQVARISKADAELRFVPGRQSKIDVLFRIEDNRGELHADLSWVDPIEVSFFAKAEIGDGRVSLAGGYQDYRLDSQIEVTSLSLKKLVPEAEGTVGGVLEVDLNLANIADGPAAIEIQSANTSLDFTNLAYSNFAARRLKAEASASGKWPQPSIDLAIRASELRAGSATLQEASVTVAGRAGRYELSALAPLPTGATAQLEAVTKTTAHELITSGQVELLEAPFSPLTARFEDAAFDLGTGISVAAVSVRGDGVHLTGRGMYNFAGPSRATVTLLMLDLPTLQAALPLDVPLQGTMTGEADFRGTVERPRLEASASLDNGAIGELTIDTLRARLEYSNERMDGELDIEQALDPTNPPRPSCEQAKRAQLNTRIEVGNRTTTIDTRGLLGGREVAVMRGTASLPVRAWVLGARAPRIPPLDLQLELASTDLQEVPIVCQRAHGSIEAKLEATDVFTSAQHAVLDVLATKLEIDASPSVRAKARLDASADRATAKVSIDTEQQPLLDIFGTVPLSLDRNGLITLGNGTVDVDADVRRAPLSVLLAGVPLVARPSGKIDGQLRLRGKTNDLTQWDKRGELTLSEVSLTVKEPFLRLSDVNGRLELMNDRLVVHQLSVADRGGKVSIGGTVGLSEWMPDTLDLQARADDYPMRREGIIVATLNGEVDLGGDLGADPRVINVSLAQDMSAELPEDLGQDTQDLEQHPQVIYRGEPGFDRSLSVEEALSLHHRRADLDPEQQSTAPLVVRVQSTEPFWVRRSDFSAQLDIDVQVRSEGDRTWMEGSVDLRRGFLVLLGKSFDLKSGVIRFTGAQPIDPTLELRAVHSLRSGYEVAVDITGRASAPELQFSSTDPGAKTDTEIIALLLGAGGTTGGGDRAQSQTRSVIGGLTAGLIGSLARRELGQYVPVLAIESGGTAETTSFRAGFQVDELVPPRWRDLVLGVYVEGIVGGSGSGAKAGFLLELLFPHRLSTTATYEQPDNWSLDLLWEP